MKTKRKRRQHHRTPADVEERIYALYLTTGSFAETGRQLGVPARTCHKVVWRLAGDGDELKAAREAQREDLIARAFQAVGELIPLVKPENLGTAKSSKGSEAARAAHDLSRIIHNLTNFDRPRDAAGYAPSIRIYTGLDGPPPEFSDSHRRGEHSLAPLDGCPLCAPGDASDGATPITVS